MPATDHSSTHGWTSYVWLIYLSFFMLYPAAKPHTSVAEWIATAAGLAIFLPLYFRGYRVSGRDLYIVIAAITLLGLIYYPFNPGAGTFFVYAAAFAGHTRSGGLALRIMVVIELVTVAEIAYFRVDVWNAVWPLVFIALVGAVNAHYSQLDRSNARLRLAQEEIERLAKVAERERIARDLHDLLGHTLSLIILKSELASKLADRDPLRARDEIRDVERISREALTQVRQAVGGYRAGGLAGEIAGAKEMLRAACIECRIDVESISLAPSIETILALAVREAVTNVVRHSGAARCDIRLARADRDVRLTIADDGHGSGEAEGFGLIGMRERIAALGGTLHRDTSRGTTLTINVPIERAMERSA
ncbi:MAG TPA: sensor histidine kinase [Thermoanaerobaculia bacterium]|nr:sensor histidine kinase [Thermoanaerobaculia bacterium]